MPLQFARRCPKAVVPVVSKVSVSLRHDCWAGSDSEPCSCSRGEARETGVTTEGDDGKTYYQYTCCISGSTDGEECGDCCTNWVLIIVLPIVFVIVVGLGCCIRLQNKRRATQSAQVQMQTFAQQPAVRMGQPVVQQGVIIQGQPAVQQGVVIQQGGPITGQVIQGQVIQKY